MPPAAPDADADAETVPDRDGDAFGHGVSDAIADDNAGDPHADGHARSHGQPDRDAFSIRESIPDRYTFGVSHVNAARDGDQRTVLVRRETTA